MGKDIDVRVESVGFMPPSHIRGMSDMPLYTNEGLRKIAKGINDGMRLQHNFAKKHGMIAK